jgi:hypothetical protein
MDDTEVVHAWPEALRAAIVPLHQDLHVIRVENGAYQADANPGYGTQELDPVAFTRNWAVVFPARSRVFHLHGANRHLSFGA